METSQAKALVKFPCSVRRHRLLADVAHNSNICY
jgi:hypothetical protein